MGLGAAHLKGSVQTREDNRTVIAVLEANTKSPFRRCAVIRQFRNLLCSLIGREKYYREGRGNATKRRRTYAALYRVDVEGRWLQSSARCIAGVRPGVSKSKNLTLGEVAVVAAKAVL